MAGIYLSKCETESGRRDFHLGDIPLSQVTGQFGVRPEDHEPAIAEQREREPHDRLLVVVSVGEGEAEGTEFQPGYYRAAIPPHRAMRHCGIGLSDILGTRRDDFDH